MKIINLIIIVLIISACGQQSNKTNMAANNIFEEGDVLIFQYPDKTYGITVLVKVTLFRGHHDYDFCRTTFKYEQKPNMIDIEKTNVIGYDLPSGLSGETRKVFCTHFAQHNKLKKFAGKFEKIGTVQFRDTANKVGSSTCRNDFEGFCEKFTEYDWQNNQWSHATIKEYPLIDFID